MHEQEVGEEPELADGVIGREHRGATLPAADADADVRSLDHAHVVGAVADPRGDKAAAAFHQRRDPRLLYGRRPAADHPGGGAAQREEVRLGLLGGERVLQGAALDDQAERATPRGVFRGFPGFIAKEPRVGAVSGRRVADEIGLLDDGELPVRVDQPARVRDGHRRLQLIAREHPDEAPRSTQRLDRLRHPVLKLVLHGGGADEGAVALDELGDVGEGALAVHERRLRAVIRVEPDAKLVWGNDALREDQRSKPLAGEIVQVRFGGVDVRGGGLVGGGREALEHRVIRTLEKQNARPGGDVADDHGHALARGGEFVHREHLASLGDHPGEVTAGGAARARAQIVGGSIRRVRFRHHGARGVGQQATTE